MTGLQLVVCVPSARHEQQVTGRLVDSCSSDVFASPRPSMEQALATILRERNITNAVWSGDSDYRQASFVVPPGEPCEDILRQLAGCGIGSRLRSVVSVMPCSLCIRAGEEDSQCDPQEVRGDSESDKERRELGGTAWRRFVGSVRARLTVAQVVEGVKADAALTFDFLTLLLIASLVSALGLAENSTVILVASMLISPLMCSVPQGPVMAGTFGAVIGDRQLQRMGVMNELFGLMISMLVGFIYGLAAGCVDQDKWPTQEMLDRGEFRALWMNAVVAVASGAALSISLLGDKTAPFVGVAMSASLLPTAVNAGVLWALASVELVWPAADPPRGHVYPDDRAQDLVLMGGVSLCLTLINIVFIFLTGILFLKIKEVTPRASRSQRTFWDHDIKIARDYNRSMNSEHQHPNERLAGELSALRSGRLGGFRHRLHSHSEYPQHSELQARADSLLTWSPGTGTHFLHGLCPARLPGLHLPDYAPLVEAAPLHPRFSVTPAADPLKPRPS
ncbi:uncharacterized protein LOC134534364 isoform X2 [Bacillus rossius redtenbacheri]|uniref:uncharacterized protein LOC134534364 isoform X2 n=1 Tax=Bacillus rossius redtenbacheri TaxID=93214 RepID=UPI002FDE911E